MTDSLREGQSIPPPPQTAPPPPPPSPYHYLDTGPPPAFCPPPPPGRAHDQSRSSFKPGSEAKMAAAGGELYEPPSRPSAHAERQKKARSMIILQDSAHLPVEPTDIPRPGPASSSVTPPERLKRKGRALDNPYANVGQFSMGLYTPAKPQRKKSPLVKQLQVEDAAERAALAQAHARDLSPSGRLPHLSRAADFYQQQQLLQGPRGPAEGPFSAVIAGAVREREKRLQDGRRSAVFLSVGAGEGSSPAAADAPSLTQSRSVDERLLSRELGPLPPPALVLQPAPGGTTFIHPLTGRPLDPSSPLALALAARERALTSQSQSPASSPEPRAKHERPAPLFAPPHAKEGVRPEAEGRLTPTPFSPEGAAAPLRTQWGSLPALHREVEAERKAEERRSVVMSVVDTAQQKTAGLIVVHALSNGQAEEAEPAASPAATPPAAELAPPSPSEAPPPAPEAPPTQPPAPPPAGEKALAQGSSEEDTEPFPAAALPPALLSSSDEETREELRKIGVVPPPNEFANGLKPPDAATPVPEPPAPATPPQPGPAPGPAAALAAAEHPPAGGTPSGKPPDAPPAPESAADSGVEEADTRSSSDHHLETTSTVSTVSSMSTLSSESGEPTDTYTSYADGQTFTLDKPPVPPKPKLKSQLGKGPVTFRDPLLKQSSDSELLSQQHAASGRPRYLFQRRSKLWGDPLEPRPAPGPEDGKPTVIGELSSRLQQLNKDTRSLGEDEPLAAALDPGRKSPVSGAR